MLEICYISLLHLKPYFQIKMYGYIGNSNNQGRTQGGVLGVQHPPKYLVFII